MRYVDTFVYKKNAKKPKALVFKAKYIAITLLCIFAVIFICSLAFKSKSVVFEKQTVYGVSIGSFVAESSANYYSSVCKARGGAGGIYKEKNEYMVFAALYLSKSDANTIANNLLELGETAYVYTFELPRKKLTFESGAKTMLEEVCGIFWRVLSDIIILALDYDKDEKSISGVKETIEKRIEETDHAILTAEKLKGDTTDTFFQEILTYLAYQKTLLSQCKSDNLNSRELKIVYFDLLLLNLSLREKM